MNKGFVFAAVSGFLFSASANALLIEGNFSATTLSSSAQASEITGNIFINYDPTEVTEASPGIYNNSSNLINWIDITINELTVPIFTGVQALEKTDQVILVDSSTSIGDRLKLTDKASDTNQINTDELRRIELLFQIKDFDFLTGQSIDQSFALDWSSSPADDIVDAELKIFHRTQLGTSIGNETYSLTSLQFGGQTSEPAASVPEPASLALLGIGLGAIGLRRRFKSCGAI